MSIFRSEPMKVRSWAPKAASLTWRLYDFQLTTYAILLLLFGPVRTPWGTLSTTVKGLA